MKKIWHALPLIGVSENLDSREARRISDVNSIALVTALYILARILFSLSDIVYCIKRYRFVNQRYETSYNRPRDQIVGRHIREISTKDERLSGRLSKPAVKLCIRQNPGSHSEALEVASRPPRIAEGQK